MRFVGVARWTVVVLCVCLSSHIVAAQGTATVSGVVVDADGVELPGVSVVAADAGGRQMKSAVTDAEGRYTLAGLAAGGYTISAVLDGFTPGEVELELTAGQVVARDFTLELAPFFNNITVTAEKREQAILDVPASITAVTSDSIERQGVTTLTDIQGSIPGLSIIDSGASAKRIQIRGISSPQNLPTVGIYMDEMPITTEVAGAALDIRLLDLERVEVLRGPQGTLYGESSMGGTIKYVTKDPELDALGVTFDSAYGDTTDGTSTYRASAVVNVPVVKDTFGLRILAGTEKYPGWVDYPAQGVEDGNEGESSTFRLKGLWAVTDRFVASLMIQYQDTSFDDQNFSDEDRTAPFIIPQPISQESLVSNLLLTYDFGGFSLLSSTGWVDTEGASSNDFTALYAPIFPPGTLESVELTAGSQSDILTQEFRLYSNGDTRFQWTAGAYYRRLESEAFNESITTPNPFPFELFVTEQEDTTEQIALFGEVEYAFTKKFSTTFGLRYFRDERERSSSVGQFGPVGPNPDQSGTFSATSPRLVLSYRPNDDVLVYGSASKGFRSGGFNLVPPGCDISNTFEPENLWTYEVGSSASLSSGRLVVQGALYYNDWSDIQTLTLCPGTFVALTDNVGKATGTGVDLQLTITPIRELQFTLSGGYNDSTYGKDSLAHSDGDRVDYASKYNYALAADWSFNWGRKLPGLLHADYQVIGPFDLNFRNFGVSEPLQSDEVGLLNARLAMTIGVFQFSVYGQNLLDDNGAVSPAIPFGGVPSAVRPQPRTIGLGLGFSL